MFKDNFFVKNVVVIIPLNSEPIYVKRIPQERFHYQTFIRIHNTIMRFLESDNYEENMNKSGYDFALNLATENNIVIYPGTLDSLDTIIITVPKIITKTQQKELEKLLEYTNNSKLYVVSCEIKEDRIDRNAIYLSEKQQKTIDNVLDINKLKIEINDKEYNNKIK